MLLAIMNDEENQTVSVPASNIANAEGNIAPVSLPVNPEIRQPHDNFMLRALRPLLDWVKPAPDNPTRKIGDYTSRAFLSRPAPMPVYDVLYQRIWVITISRILQRVGAIYLGIVFISQYFVFFFIFMVIYLLLRFRWPALPGLSHLAEAVPNIPQKFWVRFSL
jgi:hypothetical protein